MTKGSSSYRLFFEFDLCTPSHNLSAVKVGGLVHSTQFTM